MRTKKDFTMKRFFIFAAVLFLFFSSCAEDPAKNESGVKELTLRQRVSGAIAVPGEVDWYHYRAVEANNLLQVNCSSNTNRPDVELLVTVYQEDGEGNKVRLYADHAPEDSQLPADIKMNIYIDTPKDIYISVRDLMDDESSAYPYYLSIDFANDSEGNENFAQAITLICDNPESCHNDCIDYVGDVDCYKFEAPEDGVYEISVDFSPFPGGTDVELSFDLYDPNGILLETLARCQQENYQLLPYLDTGEYYVLIDDYGRDDFDTASSYRICVESVSTNEENENDTIEDSSQMAYEQSTNIYSANGSLDYSEDKDWYQFSLQNIAAAGFKVLSISLDDGDEDIENFTYQINIEDSERNILLSHNYPGGSSTYQNQIKAGVGDHYLIIQAAPGHFISQSAPYYVSIQVLDVVDSAEKVVKYTDADTGEPVTGNDTIYTADVLLSDNSCQGKIGYRGDEDWYSITLDDTSKPQVLEVFLNTSSQPTYVDYYVSIMRDSVIQKTFKSTGEYDPAELKMGLLIPAIESLVPVTYHMRVCDYQGNDGDGLTPYLIKANLQEIPESLQPDPAIDSGDFVYYNEIGEIEDETAVIAKLEHTSLIQKDYKVNRTLLHFNDPNHSDKITIERTADQAVISFPWIGGYIDFQGDQDWFRIDLGPLYDNSGPASDWYYDIKVDFHVGAPGSEVEYVWKFYRDINQNRILVDRPGDSDGFMASAGDTDTIKQSFDITIPANIDQEFWVGDAWEGKFYLSISDFNYVNSHHPDDDWGYDGAPYYFKLTLTYHPGESQP